MNSGPLSWYFYLPLRQAWDALAKSQQERLSMIKEHKWKPNYTDSASGTVEQCDDCPVQRRNAGNDKWQYRAFADAVSWMTSSGLTAPDCSDAGASWFGKPIERTTEELETELKELSARIAADPLRFQQVREELARRHAAGGDQPTPETWEQQLEKEAMASIDLQKNLVLKITAMEAEQAKLVVEAELFKIQRDEAQARLALLVTTGRAVPREGLIDLRAAIRRVPPGGASGEAQAWIVQLHRAAYAVLEMEWVEQPSSPPTTTPHLEEMRTMLEKHAKPEPASRVPLSRDQAKVLGLKHKYPIPGYVDDWVIDAIIEASK